jgi:hypothetical protein
MLVLFITKRMEAFMNTLPNQLREWIADNNAFPLSKKIVLPLDKDSAKYIFDQVHSTLEDGAYPAHRRFLERVIEQLKNKGFTDHWENWEVK